MLASTSTASKNYGKITYSQANKNWALNFACDSNCANCDVTTVTLTLGATAAVQYSTGTKYFTLSTATKGFAPSASKTSAATLSFYAFALIALLLAALF